MSRRFQFSTGRLLATMTLLCIASACLGRIWPVALWLSGAAIGTLLKNMEAGFWIAVLLTPFAMLLL